MGCGDTRSWTLGMWLERSTCCPAALPGRIQGWGGSTWPKPARVRIHPWGDPTDAGARPRRHELQLGVRLGVPGTWEPSCAAARPGWGRVKGVLEKGALVGWHRSHHPKDR